MPRRGWGAFESSDGWIKILRGNRPPAEQWHRVQKQTTVVSPELKGRWRNGAPNTPKLPSKLQSLEAALSSLGPEDSGAVELEAALTRVRAQLKPKPRVSNSPDVAREEAKLKVTRLEKALEAMGDSSGAEVDCLQRALAKAQEAARERPLEIQMKECREFMSRAEHRVVKLEADVMAEKNLLEEGRARLSRLEQQSQALRPPVVPSSRVAELEQQINALVQERDAFRAVAIPTKKRGPVTPRPPQSSAEAHEVLMTRAAKRHAGRPVEEDVMPEDAQGLSEWLIDRQCDLRDAMEFVDLQSVFESVDLGRRREVAGVGGSEPCHVDGVKYGAMRSVDLWTVASARDARYGLRGVRVGEANNPGPRRLWRHRCASSSEDELLFRPMEGLDVIPRMESRSESGSNRFAALADPETVPAGTQELEVAGFIRERSSIAGDCDRIPETILDALEEDLERPSRRLVLVGGGSTPLAAEDTQRESISIPHQSGVTFVDMTTNDSDAENPHRSGTWSHRSPRRRLRLIGTQSTHVDPVAVESSRGGHRFVGLSDEAEEPMEDVPTGGVRAGQDLSGSDTESINGVSDAEGEDIREPVAPTEPVGVDFRGRPPVRAFASLDSVNLVEVFNRRANVMRAVPLVFRGAFRSALKLAMQEIVDGARSEDLVRCTRAWKLFFLLPRMLLFRPVRRGLAHRTKLEERFRQFQSGDWTSLLLETAAVSAEAQKKKNIPVLSSGGGGTPTTMRPSGSRGQWLGFNLGNCLQRGRLWRERKWLQATLAELTNPERRPQVPRQPINEDIMRMVPGEQFQLDPDEFLIGLRKARRGAAAGPSGMTSDHLFPILESEADSDLLVQVGALLSIGNVPESIL